LKNSLVCDYHLELVPITVYSLIVYCLVMHVLSCWLAPLWVVINRARIRRKKHCRG